MAPARHASLSASTCDMRQIEFRSEHYLTVDREAPSFYGDPLFGAYRAGDDRFVRLHMNFQHHRENVLEFLD
jgi:hypothetical protein